MNLTYCFLFLIASMFVISGFDLSVFAEVAITQTSSSLGSQHAGIMTTTRTPSSDGSIVVFLTSTEPIKGERMSINPRFVGEDGKEIEVISYDILATQNGQVVLSEKVVNRHVGSADNLTQILPSNDRVNITITIQGMENHPITISQGEPIDIIVVPEFGTITMMILVISIMSIVIISAKSKVSFKSWI